MQACILIPVGIIAYTVTGGLKATFISSYIHTVIIYVVLCLFCFLVYSPSSVTQLGSPARVRFSLLSQCDTCDCLHVLKCNDVFVRVHALDALPGCLLLPSQCATG